MGLNSRHRQVRSTTLGSSSATAASRRIDDDLKQFAVYRGGKSSAMAPGQNNRECNCRDRSASIDDAED
jgi:hypothetical protein